MLGTDNRQKYLGELLLARGYPIIAPSEAECLICPIYPCPDVDILNQFSKVKLIFAGCISQTFFAAARSRGIICYDYLSDENFLNQNAIATAEATIAEAILRYPGNLTGSHCLVIGYGHCGKALVTMLKHFSCKITVCDNNEAARDSAATQVNAVISPGQLSFVLPQMSCIFNTAPALVLNKSLLSMISKDSCILDIASAPGGIDYSSMASLSCTAHLLPGLPGKYAPKASAEIMLELILHRIGDFYDIGK